MARRPKIPQALVDEVLYKSAFTCCVCRVNRARQVHHINENPHDNGQENLVALCWQCHGEAHADYKLAQNLTAKRIIEAKSSWEDVVQEQALERMSTSVSGFFGHPVWNYFNFSRLVDATNWEDIPEEVAQLRKRLGLAGLLDEQGLPIARTGNSPARTIFETMSINEAAWVERFYSNLVDDLIQSRPPLDLVRVWTHTALPRLAVPGRLAFINVGLYFRAVGQDRGHEQRLAKYSRRGIRLEFQFDTWNISTNTSLNYHFTGHTRVAALMFLRSAEVEESVLVLRATPLALGVGFPSFGDREPLVAKIRASQWEDEEVDEYPSMLE